MQLCVTLRVVTIELHTHGTCNKTLAKKYVQLYYILVGNSLGKEPPTTKRKIFNSNDYLKT